MNYHGQEKKVGSNLQSVNGFRFPLNKSRHSLIVTLQASRPTIVSNVTSFFENSIPKLVSCQFMSNYLQGFKTENEPSCCECPSEMIPFSVCTVWKTAYFSQPHRNFRAQKRENRTELWEIEAIMRTQGRFRRSTIHIPKTHFISISPRYNILSGTSNGMTSHLILLMFSVQRSKSTIAECHKPLFNVFLLGLILYLLLEML